LIKKRDIDLIFEAARIEEVVGDFVKLNRRGVNYIGLCPFHNEKTPSFTVSPAKGIYKCFGCGKAGNAVNFVMEHEHYSYPEALRFLASKYKIEIEEEQQTPEQIAEMNEQEGLFSLNSYACKYFSENLFEKEEGKAIGLSYLKERGFREDIIRKFQLGYAIDQWEDFTRNALGNGYKLEYLDKTGLSIVKDGKKTDRFKGRVMFPIHNLTGKVIGFGGRTLSSDKKTSKYVNSPESEIYSKSLSLYGIYFARNSIVSNDNCYLVEGYTDVITMHQGGFENVVASSGTSLTTGQIRLIKRFTNNITILYDGDEAGLKASFRGIDMILESGMNVRTVLFPQGEDPDSFVRSRRTSEVEDFLKNNAVNFISFKTKLLINDIGNDPVKKAGLVKEIVNTVALVPDGIYRSFYIKECSAIMDIPEQTLMNELNRVLRKKLQERIRKEENTVVDIPENTEPAAQKQYDPGFDTNFVELQEREIIRLLLNHGKKEFLAVHPGNPKRMKEVHINVANFIINDIQSDELTLSNGLYQEIFDIYCKSLENDIIPDEDVFLNHESDKIRLLFIDLVATRYNVSENWSRKKIVVPDENDRLQQVVTSTLLVYKARMLEKLIGESQKELQEAGNDNDRLIILNKLKILKMKSMEINNKLSRIIIK